MQGQAAAETVAHDGHDRQAARRELELGWLVAGRICLLSIVLLGCSIDEFLIGGSSVGMMERLYGPLIVLFAFSALSALWLRSQRVGYAFLIGQLALDVVIVTGVIYLTGGPRSPFLFLYLPLTMATAAMLSQTTGLLIAALNGIAYVTLIGFMFSGVLPAADGSFGGHVLPPGIMLQIISLVSAMVLVAVLTSFLMRKLRATSMHAERSYRDLVKLTSQQKALLHSIQDGVVILNLAGEIVDINQMALDLLRSSELEALGTPLPSLLYKLDRNCDLHAIPPGQIVSARELEISDPHLPSTIRLVYHGSPIFDETSVQTGSVFVFQDVTKLRSIEEQLELQEQMARLLSRENDGGSYNSTGLGNFVGDSAVMRKVFKLIERVAHSDATVLIGGESGTGKELVARAIHSGGVRGAGPFVPVNCGAIPENLIESQLFGHKRGSFTGADSDHKGLFQQAEGGTIFLDEIGELPLSMQVKLLRALQDRRIRMIGGDRDIQIDVRVIAASNRNLRKEIDNGNFREDLFYRLNVISIQLPPLRERKDDIPILVNSILRSLVDESASPVVSPAAMKLMLAYDYPGNVRELENVLERALVLGGEVILPEHLPDIIRSYERSPDSSLSTPTTIVVDESVHFPVNLDTILNEIERKYLEVALLKARGGKKKAAELLGINFRSFRYRLQKYQIGEGD